MQPQGKPFNEEEQAIMDKLVDAFNTFCALSQTHPDHIIDFKNGIHSCQNVLIHRIVQREYPQTFPTHMR